jgi:hypothetical protein
MVIRDIEQSLLVIPVTASPFIVNTLGIRLGAGLVHSPI